MHRKIPVLFLILLLVIPLSLAQSTPDYTVSGTSTGHYDLGRGIFNANLVDDTVVSRNLIEGKQVPYVGDLDNDGVNEIVVADDDSINLYHSHSLTIVDSYDTGISSEMSNVLIYDIDGDGLREVMVVNTITEDMHIIEYNGTDFYNQTSWTNIFTDYEKGNADVMIQCRGVNDCFLVHSDSTDSDTGGSTLYGMWFNSTYHGSDTALDTASFTGGVWCLPLTRTIQVDDYDQDGGDPEYIFSSAENDASDIMVTHVYFVRINGTNHMPLIEVQTADHGTSVNFPQSTVDVCNAYDIGYKFTPPLTFDAKVGGQHETILGIMDNANEYRMYSYKGDGTALDQYPEILQSDGIIVSNVIKANTFTDTGDVDFCVLGYDSIDNQLDLTCASEQTGELIETDEFFYDAPPFNVTPNYNTWNTIIHSGQHSSTQTDGNDLSEIITSYGVFSLDYTLLNELVPEYLVPQEDGAVVTVDAEGFGLDDMLILKESNIFYVDDGQSNGNGEISSIYYNPCVVDTTIKVNETLIIQVVVEDTNPVYVADDTVSASVIMYDGGSNEYRQDYPNVTSGATIQFNVPLNETVTLGTITIIGRDSANPTIEDEVTQLFTVQNNGLEQGDVTCTQEFVVGEETTTQTAEEQAEALFLQNNTIVQSNDAVAEFIFGVPATQTTRTIMWMVVMILVAFGLIVGAIEIVPKKMRDHTMYSVVLGIALVFIETLLLIIGVLFGFIGFGVILTLFVVGVLVIGFMFRDVFLNRLSPGG